MKTKLITLAGALTLLMVLGHFYAKPLLAQVKAALVQNVDEAGRNPYQERIFSICTGSQFCNFNYSIVPNGKRLVMTNVTGYIDVTGGTPPNANIDSSASGPAEASIYFTGLRGPTTGLGTRYFFNQEVRAYFGPGETPHGFAGVVSTPDTFSGGAVMAISGYYVSVP